MNIRQAQLPKGWEIKKLGEVCDFQGGAQPPKSQFIFEPKNGYVRFLQIRDFASDKNITYIPESKKNRYCKEDDILLGRYGASVGKVLVNKAGAYNVAVMKTISNEALLYKRYLFFYLNTYDFQTRLVNTASRSAQDGFSKDDIFDFPILIPPLPEQQRIVSILDEAFAAIAKAKANAEQNLKNAKELFESYLQAVFDKRNWETKKLNEITEVKDGTHDSPKYVKEGIPFITQKNIKPDGLSFDDTKFITDTYHEKFYKRSNVTYGDILISMIGANRGMAAKVDDKRVFSIKNVGLIKSSDNINMNYLLYYLKSSLAMKYVLYMSNGGAQEFVGLTALRSFPIPLPPLKEQHSIVRNLDALRAESQKLEAVYLKKIADLEELKKSILQKAFAGELTASLAIEKPFAKVISLQKVEGISTTDLQAGITAFALTKHIEKQQQNSFHHVKAEKIVHLAEYILNIDLERNPVKDAAGPNDFAHAKKVESRARKAAFYNVYKNGEHYDYKEGNSINTIIQKTNNCLGEKANLLSQIIDMFIPMKTQQAEIVATVYAAWNNLILKGNSFTDEEIVIEARDNWHTEKHKIPKEKFFNAIEWMRQREILVPKGNGKIVAAK